MSKGGGCSPRGMLIRPPFSRWRALDPLACGSICGSSAGGATCAAVAANRRTSPLAEVVARASRVGAVESQAR